MAEKNLEEIEMEEELGWKKMVDLSAAQAPEQERGNKGFMQNLEAEDSRPPLEMQRAMEAASFSLCCPFPIPRTAVHEAPKTPFVSFHSHSASALNSVLPIKKTRITRTIVHVKASEDNANSSTSQLLGLLLEVEGPRVCPTTGKVYWNSYFLFCGGISISEIRAGLCKLVRSNISRSCKTCSLPMAIQRLLRFSVYSSWYSVVKIGPTVPPCMNRDPLIGWPTSLPTNEKENFMKSVLREKQNALDELAMTERFSLRPGVEDFIDDACNDGVPVVFLTAYSKNGEKMARAVIGKLGHERISKIIIVGKEEVEGSFYGQLVLGKGVSSTLDEQLAREAVKAASVEKQRIAKEVASMLKLSVDIDTIPAESLDKIVATLRAGAESACLPVSNCILIAGSQSGLLGAERLGMPCVVVRNSFTARAEFSSANAVMDGFGGADLTLSKLKQKRWS
ncbi:hypothetical protein ACLOJK_020014 [Asimina triloba]